MRAWQVLANPVTYAADNPQVMVVVKIFLIAVPSRYANVSFTLYVVFNLDK